MLKRKGLNMEPWGTPIILYNHVLKNDSSSMIYCRFEREAHSYYAQTFIIYMIVM